MTEPLIWGFGLSTQAEPLLQRLLRAGVIARVALPPRARPGGAMN